ncbi:MAG: hypothetical protein ACTSVV_18525 [Promethearchaeota archaeon]
MDLNELRMKCIAKKELNNIFYTLNVNFSFGQGSPCNLYLLDSKVIIVPKSNIVWDSIKFKKRTYFDPISISFSSITKIWDNIESNALSATYTIYIETNTGFKFVIKQFKMGFASKKRLSLDEFFINLYSVYEKKLSDKSLDLLRTLNLKIDGIKNDVELIKEFSAPIEEILTKFNDMGEYLQEHLDSDWEKIKDSWQAYKNGEIGKKELVKRGIKTLGKKFILIFLSRPSL